MCALTLIVEYEILSQLSYLINSRGITVAALEWSQIGNSEQMNGLRPISVSGHFHFLDERALVELYIPTLHDATL